MDLMEERWKQTDRLFDAMMKGFQSLLVAHGAAVVACLAALKDYDSTPAYKGIGVFITLFAIGLMAASAGYIFMLTDHANFVQALYSKEEVKVRPRNWNVRFAGLMAMISLALFLFALFAIVRKFYSL